MEGLCICIIPFIIICIIAGILVSSLSSKNKLITGAWEKFASDSDLNITFNGLVSLPQVTGKYRDFDYILETVTEGYGEDSITYTVITMKLPEASKCNLHIYEENFLSKVGKMFGGQDIQKGNKEFDDSFIIKSQTPHLISNLLTQELQRKMLYGKHLINISLSGKKLQNKTGYIIENAQDLLYLSEIMVELAMNVSGKEITSQAHYTKELSDRSYKREKRTSRSDPSHKTLQKSSDVTSDFTSDFNDTHSYDEVKSSYSLKEEKLCPSCGASSPGENKYCIDCGREI
jgi:hypothetical protein